MKKKIVNFINKHLLTIQIILLSLVILIFICATVIPSSADTIQDSRYIDYRPLYKFRSMDYSSRSPSPYLEEYLTYSITDGRLPGKQSYSTNNFYYFNDGAQDYRYYLGYTFQNDIISSESGEYLYCSSYYTFSNPDYNSGYSLRSLTNSGVNIVFDDFVYGWDSDEPIIIDASAIRKNGSITQTDNITQWVAYVSFDASVVNNTTGAVSIITVSDQAVYSSLTSNRQRLIIDIPELLEVNYYGAYIRNLQIILRPYNPLLSENESIAPLLIAFQNQPFTKSDNYINEQNRLLRPFIGGVQIDVPDDWFGWIVNGVNGFMQLQILPNVTLWTVFYGILGLILFIVIMKKFAGG